MNNSIEQDLNALAERLARAGYMVSGKKIVQYTRSGIIYLSTEDVINLVMLVVSLYNEYIDLFECAGYLKSQLPFISCEMIDMLVRIDNGEVVGC